MADCNLESCEGPVCDVSDMHTKGEARSELQKRLDEVKAVERPSDPVIDAMGPEITDEDITALFFHWTTLGEFNRYQRG